MVIHAVRLCVCIFGRTLLRRLAGSRTLSKRQFVFQAVFLIEHKSYFPTDTVLVVACMCRLYLNRYLIVSGLFRRIFHVRVCLRQSIL